MNASFTVISAVIPVFGVIGLGLLIRKLNWLTGEADQSLVRVNINLLFPCLILDSAVGNAAFSNPANLVLAPLVGFAMLLVSLSASYGIAQFLRLSKPAEKRTFAVTVAIQNYSYMALPLAILLFGAGTTGVLFLHNVGVETGMWTLGVMMLSGAGLGRSWRNIFNAPFLAIVLAAFVNATGADAHVPAFLHTAIHWLGQCAIPMSLLLIGAIVSDYLREFHSAAGWRVIGAAILLRLAVLPMLILLVARFLPASVELKQVLVLQAAMPSAVFPIVMSSHYGGDPPTALRVVLGTALLGLLTIPLWIKFGMHFAGL